MTSSSPSIAVLLPCRNEAAAITQVVQQFQAALPSATIHVFDNASTDDTVALATQAGARVHHVDKPGKGNVVRRMFADIDADIYVLADGDATYHAPSAPKLIEQLCEGGYDMVVGTRVHEDQSAYRSGHQFGNKMLTGVAQRIFGGSFSDMLSGYRIFSRRFVKSFPALAQGFEIETELTVHALELRMPCAEQSTPYGARPEGSESKLSTYRDGFRILRTLAKLYASERPLWCYAGLALVLALLSAILIVPVLATYLDTGLVPRFPSLIAGMGLGLLAGLSLTTGAVLDTVTRGRHELKRLHYLAVPPPPRHPWGSTQGTGQPASPQAATPEAPGHSAPLHSAPQGQPNAAGETSA
ncbi:glycosyl transferase [Halomonas sp. 141]|uniref:glycosyltransferase family 2 protein n=1 Tax=Halomonas sp. 141 TaxID=2056666 RepID=UPI000C29D09F|nr:glycosyltransferase family 2 protein [Halomonas sp. 141]PJX13598.1 glycosyl transferase [Halomonas sp. 141]